MNIFFKIITNKKFLEYFMLVIGCVFISISFNLFLCPNKIASGGLPGLSIILYKLLGINTAYLQLGINIPLFFLGILVYGKGFGLKTIFGSFFIPIFIFLTQSLSIIYSNLLVPAVMGGIGVGIGLFLIFKSKSSVGGFSLVAQIIHGYTGIKHSKLMMMLNGSVIFLAGLSFGFEGAFYAFLSLLITSLSMEVAPIIFVYLKKFN